MNLDSGSVTELANLTSDGKRKGARVNTEAESIDALERGGLTRSSAEAAVMAVERRGRAPKRGTWSTGTPPGRTEEIAYTRQGVVGARAV